MFKKLKFPGRIFIQITSILPKNNKSSINTHPVNIPHVFITFNTHENIYNLKPNKNHKQEDNLKYSFGNLFDELKIVKCDLNDEKLDRILTNSKYVIHAANADVTGGFFNIYKSEE